MSEADSQWPSSVARNWRTFLDMPPLDTLEGCGVVILPIPYDSTTSFKGGARYGPQAIIDASRHMEDYDIELDRDVSAVGFHTTPEIEPRADSPLKMVEAVAQVVAGYIQPGRLVVSLGGEHTITVGAVRAHRDRYPDLSVLYLDAHADLRDEFMGSRWSHACVARRVSEICPVVHVGVRSMCEEERDFIRATGAPVHFWPPHGHDIDAMADAVIERLSDNVYLSIDVDVFDPSFMAAVGTPEPGGLGWYEALALLKKVAANRRIVGFDVNELSPIEGPDACAYTVAKLVLKLVGYITVDRDSELVYNA